LRCTLRNLPSHFLCLKLLYLSAWWLHLHQLFLVSSPFIGGRTPLIRCFCNSSSFHPWMHWKGPRLLPLSRVQETFCCTTFFTQSLLWASSRNSSSPCTYRLITVPHWILRVLLHNLCVLSCNFGSPDFSLFFAFMFDNSSSCHNIYPSQNRVPIFIPLLYFSSIIRVFINSPLEKSQSPNLPSLEKSPLHQILEHTEPNCSFVLSSC
jgi:hypothetical protein